MTAIQRIGILTSGGDCAGLNAAIRAVVFRASRTYGWTVIGIRNGTAGLLVRPREYEELTVDMFPGTVLRQGGTILGTTNSGDPFAYPMNGRKVDRSEEVIEGLRELRIDALIGIGGDGSLAILRRLAEQGGIPLVGIPKTIDNDIGQTEVSIGYATAVDVATEALDRLQPTAASHSRVMVLEVMGRDAGHIALAAGIAGGADVILLPEIPYRLEKVAEQIAEMKQETGRNFALVVVAEAVRTEDGKSVTQAHKAGGRTYGGIGQYVGERISELTGAETRVTVLGHVQRGGMPSSRDRLMASIFGAHAVDLIAQGRFDRMVAWQNRRVVDVPIAEAIEHYQAVDPDSALVLTARGLGIYVGGEG
jgi:phosphofructokinase-like protein